MRWTCRVSLLAICLCVGLAGCSGGSKKTYFSTRGLKAPEVQCSVNPHTVAVAEPIRDIDERNGCQVHNAWKVSAVSGVAFSTPATLNCGMIGPLDEWLTNSVQPAAQRRFGESVVAVDVVASYSCRPQNGKRGAKMSQHGFGNAVDIASFTLESGRKIEVEQGYFSWGGEKSFVKEIEDGACADFNTVLGPGDAHHDDHIHLDRSNRRRKLC
jgi:hypothetical protein